MAPIHALRRNRLLASLPDGEIERLSAKLTPVPLPFKQTIYRVRSTIDSIYFPTSGIISAMTVMENGDAIEIATIGNEGMTGLTVFNGEAASPYDAIVQLPGDGLRMVAEDFKQEMKEDGPFNAIVAHYNRVFAVQVYYAVACNGLHKVEQRCRRWLLMTHDRIGERVLPLTHEFLGVMLGVRRASVSDILGPLQEAGIIRNGRGEIEILDRPELEKLACECYRVVNREFTRLFGLA